MRRRASRTQRPSHRHVFFERLESRRLLTAEGSPYFLEGLYDISGIGGNVSAQVQWGDGRTTNASIAAQPTSSQLKIRFDYSLDTSGFFSSAERRELLQRAADSLTSKLSDSLTAITPSGQNSWTARFQNPSTGSETTRQDLVINANEILVYVGARDLPGNTIAFANRGGHSARAETQAFLDNVKGRGQAGALTSPPTDYGPWGGSLAFDSQVRWHFGQTTDGLDSNEFDFMTIAQHELMHVLGFGTSDSFDRFVTSQGFTGSNSVAAANRNPVPMDDADHFHSSLSIDGRAPLMDVGTQIGKREHATRLDFAALQDIGWSVRSQEVRVNAEHIYGDNGTMQGTLILRGSLYGELEYPFQVTTTNVAPTLVPSSDATATAGIPISLPRIGEFTDPGFGLPARTPPVTESFTYSIQWGDGTPEVTGTPTISQMGSPGVLTQGFFGGTHTYASPGQYEVKVTVQDDDGGRAERRFTIRVSPDTTVLPPLQLEASTTSFSENAGAGAATIVITRSQATIDQDLIVSLTSSDETELTLPSSVVIPAGSLSMTVGVSAVDDSIFDGSQQVVVTASAPRHESSTLDFVVHDHQPISLALQDQRVLHEDRPEERSGSVTVQIRSPAPTGGATVTFESTPAGHLSHPTTVVIPAGETEVTIPVEAIDNHIPQGSRTVRLSASGEGLVTHFVDINITDDDESLWTNPDDPYDVDGDGIVSPLDVLAIINIINTQGARFLDPIADADLPFVDTNGDGSLDPLDALFVINELNRRPNNA